ncbi:MAG: hypothetical protein JO122_14250 [Acetobacteraceae bacterium]|nr:hypothetical protein [Acetobacteraceae bacterium]
MSAAQRISEVGRHCNEDFDAPLAQARAVTDAAARQAVDRKLVDKVRGFVPDPDGLTRPQGMEVVP